LLDFVGNKLVSLGFFHIISRHVLWEFYNAAITFIYPAMLHLEPLRVSTGDV